MNVNITTPKKKKNKNKKKINHFEYQSYFDWLAANNVNTTCLSLEMFEDIGRGVKANKDIPPNTVVASVPLDALVNKYTIREGILKPLFKQALKEDDTLAIWLMHERHMSKIAKPTKYAEHIIAQPTEYTSALYWKLPDVEALQGSNLQFLTLTLSKQVQTDYEDLAKTLRRNAELIGGMEGFTLNDFKWAHSTVWSRAFDLMIDGRRLRCLCPFGDMFNHSFDAQVEHHYDEKTKSLIFKTTKQVYKDEQVFITYDPTISNSRLLQLYGFCIENNPNDHIDFYASISEEVPHYEWKLKIMRDLRIDPTKPYPIGLDGVVPPALFVNLRIQGIASESDMMIAKKSILADHVFSVELETIMLDTVQNALVGMLNGYAHPLAVDEDNLAKHNSLETSLTENEKNFAILRISEKKILKNAVRHLIQLKLKFVSEHPRALQIKF